MGLTTCVGDLTCSGLSERKKVKKVQRIGHCASISTPYDCDYGERVDRNELGSKILRQRLGYIREFAILRQFLVLGKLCEGSDLIKNPPRIPCKSDNYVPSFVPALSSEASSSVSTDVSVESPRLEPGIPENDSGTEKSVARFAR